jgi:hypothetical protein
MPLITKICDGTYLKMRPIDMGVETQHSAVYLLD